MNFHQKNTLKNNLIVFLLLLFTSISGVFAGISSPAYLNENGSVLDGSGNVISAGDSRSYGFTSQGIGSGSYYVGGFYKSPVTSVTLTQASPTQTHGTAGNTYGAHAFIVASGAGTASGGTGTVEIEVSGTSVTDAGVETINDTQIILVDITTLTTDQYLETSKKWTGTVTYALQPSGAGTHTTYSATFNYGYAKYDDFGNRDFTIDTIEMVGLAGANDTAFDMYFFHHEASEFTYHATAFDPMPHVIGQWTLVYTQDNDLKNGEYFAGKLTNIGDVILGSGGEGFIFKVVTGTNNSVEHMDVHVGITLQ